MFAPFHPSRRAVLAGSLGAALMPAPLSALPPGFFVPAEEAPHQATFMQWPVSRRVYPDRYFLEEVQSTIARVANTISAFEPVFMLADRADHSAAARQLSQAVTLWDIPTEDLWARDSGPLFVTSADGRLAISNLNFNGWGNRQVHTRDGAISQRVADRLGLENYDSALIGEPGGLDQDGHGLLIAHESSWVNRNRNTIPKAEISKRLLAAFGAERIVWSPGLAGQDITDYHIDSLARLTGPGRVLIQLPDRPDPADPFHQAALRTYDDLQAAGLSVDVIPDPVDLRVDSYDFVAAYANYYVCNGAVIAAQFGDKAADQEATRALKRHYPGREIVTLNADALGEVGGGIHCATQQMPAT